MALFSGLTALLALMPATLAAPTLDARQSITALSTSQIGSFKPFSFYASTAYCDPSLTLTWSCGANCEANPTFQPIASGGDGSSVQFCGSLILVCTSLLLMIIDRVCWIRPYVEDGHRWTPGYRPQRNVGKWYFRFARHLIHTGVVVWQISQMPIFS